MKNLYEQHISDGEFSVDRNQQDAVDALNSLCLHLGSSDCQLVEKNTLYRWQSNKKHPQGVYLHGTVGRGKSMLMGLLFEAVNIKAKRRVHFHSFMEELHEIMHKLPVEKGIDPIHRVASDIAEESLLLCFDEFYITNIADAMMLGRLFEKLFECGVIICATSNWPVGDLFQGGFNRSRFKPFIKQIETHLVSVGLGEGQDWRRAEKNELHHFFVGSGAGILHKLDECFEEYSTSKPELVEFVSLYNMKLPIQKMSENVVWIRFADICDESLGPEHYLELAKTFDTIIVEAIPILEIDNADTALRFVVLIDILYENKCRTVCSAESLPDSLCVEGDSVFEFERTASRLMEMQGW